ncbi:MAG: WYL domain-containing protein [Natronospirillum sp.]
MPKHNDTLFRWLATLQYIPVQPARINTLTLMQKLMEAGFHVSQRSIQRDLKKLEQQFPIICDESVRPHRWSFDKTKQLSLPSMDANKALTLVLAEQYLSSLLPQAVMDSLAPQIREAQRFINSADQNDLANWHKRVRAVGIGQTLVPAPIAKNVWAEITEGLLRQKALKVIYSGRGKEEPDAYIIHPQGLVYRNSVTYLLATVKDYDDIRQFALHRFHQVSPSIEDYRLKVDFNLDQYIADGGFGYNTSGKQVELKAWVHPELYTRLSETPLNETQRLTVPNDEGWGYMTANVNDELSIQWWLQALGAKVRVEAPQHWREALKQQAEDLTEWYRQS